MKKILELDKKYDEKGEFRFVVQIDTKLIQCGVLKDLRPMEFMVLSLIASHMDENCECFPSIDYIAKLIGSTKPTVLKAIRRMLNFRYEGVPIMTRIIEGTGVRKNQNILLL